MDDVRPDFKKQYPTKADLKKPPCRDEPTYERALDCMIAGVWHNFASSTKKKLSRRYEGKSNPEDPWRGADNLFL